MFMIAYYDQLTDPLLIKAYLIFLFSTSAEKFYININLLPSKLEYEIIK
jgi:hypothetical protein